MKGSLDPIVHSEPKLQGLRVLAQALAETPKQRPKVVRLMIYIPHYLKDPKLWELWSGPEYG